MQEKAVLTMRILMIEGNTAEARAKYAKASGKEPSQHYCDVLAMLRHGLEFDIVYPADGEPALPRPLEDYDGAVITGSALNIEYMDPPSVRQIEMAKRIFEVGLPFLGSCWGLQVATVAAGGTVCKNPHGREVGIARRIERTAAGVGHLFLTGRGHVFDALATHSDYVNDIPPGMTVLAGNENTPVQAAEIRFGKGVFWGVQYHPEFTFDELACIIQRLEEGLVEEGFFHHAEDLEEYVAHFRSLDQSGHVDLAWRYGVERDLLDPFLRRVELANWLQYQVLPFIAQKTQ